ncbi:hypothetical protein [Sphingobacterium deserti]|uniref:Uncharacterized protein n=1 Tax=Sphingobacterium deserti TaxID=1229276 RepID=A0A0B8SZG8_9SPHI|nr:hypothetical protein [Sphingobacterium deserti]KGE12926.1 hypothetical protein DI53_3363 [Sphingobacterium deserti]
MTIASAPLISIARYPTPFFFTKQQGTSIAAKVARTHHSLLPNENLAKRFERQILFYEAPPKYYF